MIHDLYQDILDLDQAGILQTSGYALLSIKYGQKRLIQSSLSLQRDHLIALDLHAQAEARILLCDRQVRG